jgi:F-type H+-transporting ATPase subunit a
MKILTPLEQFEINVLTPIFYNGIDLSITNAVLYSILAVTLFILLLGFQLKKFTLIPSKLQIIFEGVFMFVLDTLLTQAGKKGENYFPLFFTTFVYILFANLLGLTPFGFTITSHIIVDVYFSVII